MPPPQYSMNKLTLQSNIPGLSNSFFCVSINLTEYFGIILMHWLIFVCVNFVSSKLVDNIPKTPNKALVYCSRCI